MEYQRDATQSDRDVTVRLLIAEYQRVTGTAQEAIRHQYAGYSLAAILAGAAMYAGFTKWDEPIVSAFILNAALPFTVLMAFVAAYVGNFEVWTRADYLESVLEKRAHQLSVRGNLAPTEALNTEDVRQMHRQLQMQNIWAWDSWAWSETFRRRYRTHIQVQYFLVTALVLLLLVVPITGGYLRIFLNQDWNTVGMGSILHPVRLMLALIPIPLSVVSVIAAVGLWRQANARSINRKRSQANDD